MNIQQRFNRYFLIALFSAATFLVLLFASQATADNYGLPPRGEKPTQPEEPSVSVMPVGARLILRAQFDSSWPWGKMQWQDVWTTIQWSDGRGNWYDVAGWQGNLDSIGQENDNWVGHKEWWVGVNDLGTGPFRWRAYQYPGGPLLTTSEPFNLPAISGKIGVVDLALAP